MSTGTTPTEEQLRALCAALGRVQGIENPIVGSYLVIGEVLNDEGRQWCVIGRSQGTDRSTGAALCRIAADVLSE